ncbi:hypothetical protein [Moorena producens]|nr:hypothetical protein [Moorena producens]
MRASPPLTHPTHDALIPCSLFPVPCSLLPTIYKCSTEHDMTN